MAVAARVLLIFGVVVALLVAAGLALRHWSAHRGPTPLDREVEQWFADHRRGDLTRALRTLTRLGSGSVVAPLTLAVAVALAATRRFALAAFLAVAVGGGALAGTVVKHTVDRVRPPAAGALEHATGPAFPSGHATQAAVTYLALAVVALTLVGSRRVRVAVVSVCVGIVVAVGVSRVYLGVHWPTDVAGAWLLAVLWVGGVSSAFGLRPAPAPHPTPGRARPRRRGGGSPA